MNDIGIRLSALIAELSITKTEFANKLNITQPYVSKLINKGTTPSDRLIEDICEKFKVNEDWLRTGENEMFIVCPEEDEVAAYVSELVFLADKNDEIKKLIVGIMRMYSKLDPKGQEVLKICIREVAEDILRDE